MGGKVNMQAQALPGTVNCDGNLITGTPLLHQIPSMDGPR